METSDRASRKENESTTADQSTPPAGQTAPGTRLKSKRGFASMSPEQRAHIAAMGGAAAHRAGTAHKWTKEEASAAGRIGGKVSRGGRGKGQFVGGTRSGKTARVLHAGHQWTSTEAQEAGRKGGQESRGGHGKILDFETDGFPEQTNFGDSTRF